MAGGGVEPGADSERTGKADGFAGVRLVFEHFACARGATTGRATAAGRTCNASGRGLLRTIIACRASAAHKRTRVWSEGRGGAGRARQCAGVGVGLPGETGKASCSSG